MTSADVRPLAEAHYGKIEPTGLVDGTRKWRKSDPLTETQLITHSDPKVRQPRWSRYYTGPSMTYDRDEALALDVGLDVLAGGMTSRLYQALVEDQKVAIDIGAYAYSSLHDGGPAVISGSPVEGMSLEAFDDAVMAEVEKALADGLPRRMLSGLATQWRRARFMPVTANRAWRTCSAAPWQKVERLKIFLAILKTCAR